MPPKGSKRAADTETAAAPAEVRRSSRGGGHKAPEVATKAAPAKPRNSKKAKTDDSNGDAADKDAAATEAPAADAVLADEGPASAENGDDKPAAEEKVPVPEENKKVEEQVKESKGSSGKIQVGEVLPEGLVLKNEADEEVTVSDLTKEKGAVFFVYPKANTGGCTTQACDFRDNYGEFGPLGYDVYGLSGDGPKAQASWKEKHNFPYHLLCDPGQVLTKVLGAAKTSSSTQRSHYIVEKGGKLVDAQYTISPKDSCTKALEFIKAHQKKE